MFGVKTNQVSKSIERIDLPLPPDGCGAGPARLVFREKPVWGSRFIAITPAHLSGIGLQTMNPFANHRFIQFRIAEINLPSRNYRTGIPHGDRSPPENLQPGG